MSIIAAKYSPWWICDIGKNGNVHQPKQEHYSNQNGEITATKEKGNMKQQKK